MIEILNKLKARSLIVRKYYRYKYKYVFYDGSTYEDDSFIKTDLKYILDSFEVYINELHRNEFSETAPNCFSNRNFISEIILLEKETVEYVCEDYMYDFKWKVTYADVLNRKNKYEKYLKYIS